MLNVCMGDDSRHIIYDYAEVQTELEYPFALKSMGQFYCDDSYFTERDGLEECLLIYTISGSGKVCHGGVSRSLEAGSLVLMDCREYQDYRTSKGDHWLFFWMHFTGKSAFDYVRLINRGRLEVTQLKPERFDGYRRRLLELCAEQLQTAPLDICLLIAELLSAVVHLQQEKRLQSSALGQEAIGRAVDYAKEHFAEPISVEELASAAMLSTYYFIRLFKELMGISPHKFIIKLRINEARRLLLMSGDSVAMIGERCGFNDCKNFILQFKRMTGTTPLKFRKEALPFTVL